MGASAPCPAPSSSRLCVRVLHHWGMAELSSTSIEPLLQQLWDRRATDLLITVGTPPLVRVDGSITPLELPILTADDTDRIVTTLLGAELTARFKDEYEVDFA